jgi:DNA-binding IclR family transcriptional regulator
MVTGNFNERSLTGLSKDTQLSKSEVNACITSLMRKGLVEQGTGQRSGQPRWFPNEAGRLLAGG